MALTLGALAVTAGIATARTPPVRFTPRAHLILTNGYVVANGRHVLQVNRNSGISTLIDQSTGEHRTLANLPGCDPDALGPAHVIYDCPLDLAAPHKILRLSTGQVVATAEAGMPRRVGLRWAEFDEPGLFEHSPTTASFVNLATGAVRRYWLRAGEHVYDNVNRPSLRSALCAPLTVPSFLDGYSGSYQTGRVQFLGRTAILSSIIGDDLRTQRCGSRTPTRYAVGNDLTVGPTAVVWAIENDIDGFTRDGRRFKLDLTHSGITSDLVIEAVTATTLYLQQEANVFFVRLPRAISRERS